MANQQGLKSISIMSIALGLLCPQPLDPHIHELGGTEIPHKGYLVLVLREGVDSIQISYLDTSKHGQGVITVWYFDGHSHQNTIFTTDMLFKNALSFCFNQNIFPWIHLPMYGQVDDA